MPMLRVLIAIVVWISCAGAAVFAAEAPFVELSVDETAYQGKIVTRDSRSVWLMERDGRLRRLELAKITSFRRLSGKFRPFGAIRLRDRLQREFGREFETAAESHYVVCGPRGTAGSYAELFESTLADFRAYFRVRGFDVPEPEFPLVAIVFPNRREFVAYCARENVTAGNYLGAYLVLSNRVALYDPRGEASSFREEESTQRFARRESFGLTGAMGTIDANLRDTIVHEATHQVAYNTGLHARLGSTPRWVAEGLATVFEAPGIRESSKNRSVVSRVNRGRCVQFRDYTSRRSEKSLADFVAGDDAYRVSPSDAYAEGWALSFYLIETRPREYAAYLKKVAARDLLTSYSAEDRLADFEQAFGDRLDLLEADYLRFMARLN